MDLDFDSIRQALSTLGVIINILRQTKGLLPDGSKRQELETVIENTEEQI